MYDVKDLTEITPEEIESGGNKNHVVVDIYNTKLTDHQIRSFNHKQKELNDWRSNRRCVRSVHNLIPTHIVDKKNLMVEYKKHTFGKQRKFELSKREREMKDLEDFNNLKEKAL